MLSAAPHGQVGGKGEIGYVPDYSKLQPPRGYMPALCVQTPMGACRASLFSRDDLLLLALYFKNPKLQFLGCTVMRVPCGSDECRQRGLWHCPLRDTTLEIQCQVSKGRADKGIGPTT